MNKLKTLLLSGCALLLTACDLSLEYEIIPNTAPVESEFSIEATLAELDATQLTKAGAVPVLRLQWTEGDAMSVVNLTTGKVLGGDLVAQSSGTKVTFSGSLKGDKNKGDILGYIYPSQHYTEEAAFEEACIDLSAQNGSVNEDKFVVTSVMEYQGSNPSMVFNFQVSYILVSMATLKAGEAIEGISISNIGNTVKLKINDAHNDFKTENEKGDINITPSNKTVYGNGTNSIYVKIPQSNAASQRDMCLSTANFDYVATFTPSAIPAGYFTDITISNFSEDLKIEDPKVKAYLLKNYDADDNGALSRAECNAIKSLEVHSSSIISETGVRHMPNLENLTVNGAPVTRAGGADGASKNVNFSENPKLRTVSLSNTNDIVALDLTMNTELTSVSVTNVPVSEISFPETEESFSITVAQTELEYLDLSGLQNITTLHVSDTPLDAIILPEDIDIGNIDDCQVPPDVKVVKNNGNNVIKYTSIDNVIIHPYNADAFGNAKLLSNSYDAADNEGTMIFDGDIQLFDSMSFYCCDSLTGITIPESVTCINSHSFAYCSSLTSIHIPESVNTIGDVAFVGCSNLSSFKGTFASEDNRLLIDNGRLLAFAPAGITDYTVPTGVTKISQSAFRDCSILRNVTLPESITSIDYGAFTACYRLESINLPSKITTISDRMFYGCEALKSITIPDGVTLIETYAFAGCYSLTDITIPESVTEIGSYAFGWDSNLSKVTVNCATPPALGEDAFISTSPKLIVYIPSTSYAKYKTDSEWSKFSLRPYNAVSSNTIVYTSTTGQIVEPHNLGVFGANFESNTYENGQGRIVFDGDVTMIGPSAFEGCNTLESVVIPNTVTSIGESAFSRCRALEAFNGKYASSDHRCLIVNGVLNSFAPADLTSYSIPASVTSLGTDAFADCQFITSIEIPNSVTSIGARVFWGCRGITSIDIPNSVTSIGTWAFFNTGITSIDIPDSVTSIEDHAFYGCTQLATVNCRPTTPPSLGNLALYGTASDLKIFVPEASLNSYKTTAGWSAYADYIATKAADGNNVILYTSTDGNIVTPSKTDVFGANIVSNTYENGQGRIVFDGEVSTIGMDAFWKCVTLESVVIPDTATEIGASAFRFCSGLSSVTIGNSVSEIGMFAFAQCSSLESFYGKFASADNRCLVVNNELIAFAPAELTEYTIPSYVTAIGAFVFQDCTYLESVTIPDSVKEIGRSAFEGCTGLSTYIHIPESVTKIGEAAFFGCSNLQWVHCLPTTPPALGNNAFKYLYNNEYKILPNIKSIYVPSASRATYKSATGWSDYEDVITSK